MVTDATTGERFPVQGSMFDIDMQFGETRLFLVGI
jgi:hypothetical protein